jgi:hypothetical protein
MRAEKKSRWRADVATPLAPHPLSEGVFPLRLQSPLYPTKRRPGLCRDKTEASTQPAFSCHHRPTFGPQRFLKRSKSRRFRRPDSK